MTASSSKPRFSMASNRNFPKALIATGLAAALVGCGGGSSDDTAMGDGSSQPSQPSQEEVQQRAISAAKATFGRAQSALQTALDSATTDQQKIAAYEAMKSASDAFRDALYQNDGSAADLLIATNAYDRAESEISKLEMMIADAEKMADQQRREMAINNAKGVYDEEKEALDLVLNGPNPTEEKIFNASTQFKNAANTYLSILIANEGPQDDKVQAEKVLVQQDIDENNDERIFPFVNDVLSALEAELKSIANNPAPTSGQIDAVQSAMNKLLEVINAASLTGAARTPYSVAISGARTSINSARQTIVENIADAGRYFDAINSNPFNNTASYSEQPITTPMMDKEITVTIGATPTPLTQSGTDLSPTQGWDGKEFTGDDIVSHVWSNSKTFGSYYEDEIPPDAKNELATAYVEDANNRKLIELIGVNFDDNSLARFPYNMNRAHETTNMSDPGYQVVILSSDIKSGTALNVAAVSGYFNGVKGTFTCRDNGELSADHVCGAQKLSNGEIILGEVHESRNDNVDSDFGAGSANGQWNFLPDELDDMVVSYASFGYWIQNNSAGEPFRVGSFHDLAGREKYAADPSTRLSRVSVGTATYTGGAAGLYAFYDETEEDSYHGQFTANVTLTASFSSYQIGGMINNFEATDSTGIGRPNTWQVDLEATSFDDSGQISSSIETAGGVEWTIDGTSYGHQGSRWSGNFREFDDGTDAPDTVTGQFSAYASDPSGDDFARLIGAFGAEKQ